MFSKIDKVFDYSYFIERLDIEQNRLERFDQKYSIVQIQMKRQNSKIIHGSNGVLNKVGNLIASKIRKTDAIYVNQHKIFVLLANTGKTQANFAIKNFNNALVEENINTKNLEFSVLSSPNGIYQLGYNDYGTTNHNNTIENQADFTKRVKQKRSMIQAYEGGIGAIAYNAFEIEWLENFSDYVIYIQIFLKRLIDITGSILCLILFLPIFLINSLLIKVSSPGPVFYKQERIGYQGNPFILYKFRTLRVSKSDHLHKQYIDLLLSKGRQNITKTNLVEKYKKQINARITWAGKFLRKTSLDELPQLWNVLKGDMSLVGPRPHPKYELKKYQLWYYRRLQVRPGMTGLSKIYIRCTPENYDEAMRYDIRYTENWNLLLDIKILLRTIPMVLFLKNSY